jgi:hypothetical protein
MHAAMRTFRLREPGLPADDESREGIQRSAEVQDCCQQVRPAALSQLPADTNTGEGYAYDKLERLVRTGKNCVPHSTKARCHQGKWQCAPSSYAPKPTQHHWRL